MEEHFFRSVYPHCEIDVSEIVNTLCSELERDNDEGKLMEFP